MTTTIGDLIANFYARYERRYQDAALAAVATQVRLDDLLRSRRIASKRARAVAR